MNGNNKSKILMHTCCAPCSVYCIDTLRAQGTEPVSFWFNPNIHPFTEYKARKKTLVEYSESIGMKLIIKNEYGLRSFISAVYPDFDNRCSYCYEVRLDETAKYASENGFDRFTTTLLVSPYQNHELICDIAEASAAKYGVKFEYHDFRPGFREGQEKARELGMYMQKYCGCIFSEEDRYKKRKKKNQE